MEDARWPAALRHRLGDEGSTALADVLQHRDDNMLSVATERFERRLSEECSKLRSDMSELRSELRVDMKVLRSDVIAALADTRADLIKWAFVFWVGQLATVIALITVLR